MTLRIDAANTEYALVAVGNALTDFIATTSDDFLTKHGLEKGSMQLIEDHTAHLLRAELKETREISGGSAANSAAAFAELGGKCAFIGSIAKDPVGEVFTREIKASGVDFYPTVHEEDDLSSGRCYIAVTPDAQRTMCTYLGISGRILAEKLNRKLIENTAILYLEGYLWDLPETKAALSEAIEIAKAAGRAVAITLSDTFCIERHREELRTLTTEKADIVFANENELKTLFEVDSFDAGVQRARRESGVIFALTRSEKGSVIVKGEEVRLVDAAPIDKLVDTTGAGDAFAAGFLYGLTHGCNLYESGRLGSFCAGEVISHFGARPEKNLKSFLPLIRVA